MGFSAFKNFICCKTETLCTNSDFYIKIPNDREAVIIVSHVRARNGSHGVLTEKVFNTLAEDKRLKSEDNPKRHYYTFAEDVSLKPEDKGKPPTNNLVEEVSLKPENKGKPRTDTLAGNSKKTHNIVVTEEIRSMPVNVLPGIGPKNERTLGHSGIAKVGQLLEIAQRGEAHFVEWMVTKGIQRRFASDCYRGLQSFTI